MIAAQVLRNLTEAVPSIHTVLTDKGMQFTNTAHRKYAFHHAFDRVYDGYESSIAARRSSNPGPTGRSNG